MDHTGQQRHPLQRRIVPHHRGIRRHRLTSEVGKRRSGRTRKGPRWLDGALHDAAMGAIRVKDGHMTRKYRRIKARSGHKIAIGAVKHAILIALYHMLKNGEMYRPPIPNPDAVRKHRERTTKRLIAQLERLGHSVTLAEGAAA